jgi:hypothetical protein
MVGIGLLGLLLCLVTSAGSGAGANGTANDRARRTGHGATDRGTAHGACRAAHPCAGFLVALSSLTGDSAAGRSQGSADSGADGTADRAADDRSAHSTSGAADGLTRVLLVVRRRAIAEIGIVRFVLVRISGWVVHLISPQIACTSRAG